MIAILSAMQEENSLLRQALTEVSTRTLGRREYHTGMLFGQKLVVVFSHWGKVAAASTVTTLITEFGASEIVFTGVAGALSADLRVGDIVIGDKLFQHDMDARPMLPRHTIPLLGYDAMHASRHRITELETAATRFLQHDLGKFIDPTLRDALGLSDRQCHVGGIASGDQFISSSASVNDLRQRLPEVLCVEMEGGAVAQVCSEFDIPFSIIRTISDTAHESASVDFALFIDKVASQYSLGIMKRFLLGV